MTEAEVGLLIRSAIATGQQLLHEWATAGRMKMGEPLFLHLAWPQAHQNEPYTFVALAAGQAFIAAIPLSEGGRLRLLECGGMSDGFRAWMRVQDWHVQTTFRLRTEITPLTVADRPSGLVLPH